MRRSFPRRAKTSEPTVYVTYLQGCPNRLQQLGCKKVCGSASQCMDRKHLECIVATLPEPLVGNPVSTWTDADGGGATRLLIFL